MRIIAILASLLVGVAAAEPVKVIFDTDMITDFDDVGALACLHALADAGECEDLAHWVDPFTGTAGTGHTHPAASCPFGMVQAGPDTGCNDWAYCSGYQYKDASVLGYSLTHLSGTGCPDYGDVQILPFVGEPGKMPMRRAIDKRYAKGSPG